MPTPAIRMLTKPRSSGSIRSASRSSTHRNQSRPGSMHVERTPDEMAQDEMRKKEEKEDYERKRLAQIEKDHSTTARQLDRLKENLWFLLGLNRFETENEIEKRAVNLIEKEKSKSKKKLFLLIRRFKEVIISLRTLEITRVPGLSLKEILPNMPTESFTEVAYIDPDQSCSADYCRHNQENRSRLIKKFRDQAKLGINVLNAVDHKILEAMELRQTKRTTFGGGKKRTRKNRRTRSKSSMIR